MFKFSRLLLKQITAAKDFLAFKQPRKKERVARDKNGKRIRNQYKPGKLGVSAVSSQIKKDYGNVLSRKERKQIDKAIGEPFKAYYNGR